MSHNEQFSVLVFACLCSRDLLEEICARGINLEFRELLFLSKSFPRGRNGLELEVDTADRDYLFDAINVASDFELLPDFFLSEICLETRYTDSHKITLHLLVFICYLFYYNISWQRFARFVFTHRLTFPL